MYVRGRCTRFARCECTFDPDVLRPGRVGRLLEQGGHFGGVGVSGVDDEVVVRHQGAHLLRALASGEDGDAFHLRLFFPAVVGRHTDGDVVSPGSEVFREDPAFRGAAKQ